MRNHANADGRRRSALGTLRRKIEEALSAQRRARYYLLGVFRDPDGNLVKFPITASGVNSVSEQFDYIVVGLRGVIGASGENGKHSVLCLEAGEDENYLSKIPPLPPFYSTTKGQLALLVRAT